MQEKKNSTKKFRERERERENHFLWGKTMHRIEEIVTIYSKRVWIRRDKNKGRWRERGRMILM